MDKIKIEKNSVQETLLVPLYGRKLCTEQFPELYSDPYAAKLIEHLDYDFSHLDKKSKSFFYRFGALEAAMRQLDIKWEIDDYLENHPEATIVNMGCGLDRTGEDYNDGRRNIYNIDMPDIIAAREELMPAEPGVVNVPANLTDESWIEKIKADTDVSKGTILFGAGVFYYLTKEQAGMIINRIGEAFPGARVVFDIVGKTGRNLMMKTTLKNYGIDDISEYLYVNDINKDLPPLLTGAKVSSRGYMTGYYDLKKYGIGKAHRVLAGIGDKRMKLQIIRIDFPEITTGVI